MVIESSLIPVSSQREAVGCETDLSAVYSDRLAQQMQDNDERLWKHAQQQEPVTGMPMMFPVPRLTDALLACLGENGTAYSGPGINGVQPVSEQQTKHTPYLHQPSCPDHEKRTLSGRKTDALSAIEKKHLMHILPLTPGNPLAGQGLPQPSERDLPDKEHSGATSGPERLPLQPGLLSTTQQNYPMTEGRAGAAEATQHTSQQAMQHTEIRQRHTENTTLDIVAKTIRIDHQASRVDVYYPVADQALAQVAVTDRIIAPGSENMRLNGLLVGHPQLNTSPRKWYLQDTKSARPYYLSLSESGLKRETETGNDRDT